MAPQVPNPNWPTLFAEGNFGANPYYTPSASQLYTDMTHRMYKSWTIRRGKQFELDQVQPGEFHGQWVNKDGFLDPSNAGSPYAPGVLPYRGFRLRTQWPPSVNLLNGDVATAGQVTPLTAGTSGASLGVTSAYGTVSVTSSASAWRGPTVWQVTVPGGSATGNTLFGVQYPAVTATPGTAYTISFPIRCTSSANPTVHPFMNWVNWSSSVSVTSGSTVTLTGGSSAAWTSVTLTGTVPSGATAVGIGFVLDPTAPAGAWNFQVGAVQLERSSTASAFSAPGKSYPLYSGLVERYPQDWDYNGTYGLVDPIGVDTMALLSQMILKEAFVMDVVATNPAWFFQLNDQSGTTSVLEQAGRTPPAGIFTSSYGAGALSFGSSIQAANPPGGLFLGTQGPVVTVNNDGLASGAGTVIDLTPAGITGPPSTGGWTRMLAFRSTNTFGLPVVAASTAGYATASVGYNSNWYLQLQTTSGSNMTAAVSMYDDNGNNSGVLGALTVNDNNWHLVVFSVSSSGTSLTLYIDGVSYHTTAPQNMHVQNAVNDSVGGDEYLYAGQVGTGGAGFKGDVALYAQWNYEIGAGAVSTLYSSWRSAWSGERSDQRYSRILGWAGYLGAKTLDSGTTTNMGPANDVANADALTALENVVNTEAGRHFVGADGAVNFQSRSRLFQATSPVYVFGENQSAGEIPYTALVFDYDPTRLSNQVQVTQQQTSQSYWANDAASQASYGVRNLQRNNQSANAEEVRGSPYFYLSRYKDPHLRVQTLQVDPSTNPALWPQVLSFEIGQYVQINRRDQFGVRPTISQFGFIEQITHTADDQGQWRVDLQVSPSPSSVPYATFTDLRTTLHSSAASGQPTITINGLPDAALNPVRSQLTGGQLMMISGGGLSEFVTVDSGGVQDALAGYTTATVTFTTNLVNSYPTGSNVYEASGSNYDSFAHFDNVQFSY